MQPPPQTRFNMFNSPNSPRGRFDWSVLSESFELLKINPGTFVAFTLIGGLAAYTISQIVNIPQFLFMFSPEGLSGQFMTFSMVFAILANLSMIAVLGFMRSGIMIMAQKVMRRQLPDIPEGFQQLNRFFTYAGANVSGWILTIPFMMFAGIAFGGQMSTLMNQSRPDFTEMMPAMMGASTAYVLGGLVLLLTYPFFALAVPAAFLEKLNLVDSVKRSFELGKSNYGNLLLFSLVAGILNSAATYCCCLPVLFVYPWISIAYLLIYRDVANLPVVSEFENASQTPYPREYGMTMPTYTGSQTGLPPANLPVDPTSLGQESVLETPRADAPTFEPTQPADSPVIDPPPYDPPATNS